MQNRFGLIEGKRKRLIPHMYIQPEIMNADFVYLLFNSFVGNVFFELEALALVVNSCVESEFLSTALEECDTRAISMRYITNSHRLERLE